MLILHYLINYTYGDVYDIKTQWSWSTITVEENWWNTLVCSPGAFIWQCYGKLRCFLAMKKCKPMFRFVQCLSKIKRSRFLRMLKNIQNILSRTLYIFCFKKKYIFEINMMSDLFLGYTFREIYFISLLLKVWKLAFLKDSS